MKSLKKIPPVLLVTAILFSFTKNSYAHLVELLFSFPQNGDIVDVSPPLVEAMFNEEMQTETSTLKVLNSAGEQVDLGDGGVNLDDPNHSSMIVSMPPQLPDGEYVVEWYVVLLDNDPTGGEFNFFVGNEKTAAAANFTPISETSYDPTATDAPPSNLPWMLGGAVFALVIIAVPGYLIYKRSA